MTSKCKTCSHSETKHKRVGCRVYFKAERQYCGCEKFQPQDEIIETDYETKPELDAFRDGFKRGKQKKGCGKYYDDGDIGRFCHKQKLCPLCQNQSPIAYGSVGEAKPVLGTQSPQSVSSNQVTGPTEGTSTLSDKIWQGHLREEYVQEFIRRLKEECESNFVGEKPKVVTLNNVLFYIDKIFGEKLI